MGLGGQTAEGGVPECISTGGGETGGCCLHVCVCILVPDFRCCHSRVRLEARTEARWWCKPPTVVRTKSEAICEAWYRISTQYF